MGIKKKIDDVGTRSPTHSSWSSMKDRCFNKNSPAYYAYGGRGITVCCRWKNSFKRFVEDMGVRPSINHSIDRIDNNKGYSKNNCRWATKKEQQRNKYNTYHQDVLKIIDMISEHENITYKAAKLRLRKVVKWVMIQNQQMR
jgi:hypothetical protein